MLTNRLCFAAIGVIPLILVTFFLVFDVCGEHCHNDVFLQAKLGKLSYARWVNTSITLICSGKEFTSVMWYSVRKVYKMAIGCLKNEHRQLHLDWFPNVPEIIATYVSYEKQIRQVCIFSLSNGILTSRVLVEELNDQSVDMALTTTVYFLPNSIITNVFFICKQGEVRNGTCHSRLGNGTFYNGEKNIYKNNEFYKITDKVVPTHMGKHECFAKINGTYYVVSVIFSNISNWVYPDSVSYRFMGEKMCGLDMCIEAANQGYMLCDAGIHDCYVVNNSYRCKKGVPLIDSCEYLAKDLNWSCPHVSGNSPEIADYGRTLHSVSYNAKTLYRINPDYILNFTSKFTDDEIRQQLARNSVSERRSIASQLLDSMRFALDMSPTIVASGYNRSTNSTANSEFLSASASKKLQTVSVFLHLIAEIARQTPSVIDLLRSGKETEKSLRFWHLSSDTGNITMNSSQGKVIKFSIKPKQSEMHDTFIAVIPAANFPGVLLTQLDNIKKVTTPSLDSDVVLVDTNNGLSFTLSVDLSQKPNITVSCEQLKQNPEFKQLWNDGNCKTIVVGSDFECQCLPAQGGTFAIALVYWLGSSHIPLTHVYSISIVNYIFTFVTIVALFLFLIFTRFIGVFRLDQFNIAFCLMVSAIVSLAIPHTTDRQPILCTIIAVAVCYFPLAAFSWKFIFGLNTLILICIGPKTLRWSFVGPITTVVTFNFVILFVVGLVLLRNYLVTRKSKLNKTTHFLVLTQLMLTLGIPYIAIYIQLLDAFTMLIVVPVAMALTAVLMFLLVAVFDEENRHLLRSFIYKHIARSSEYSSGTMALRNLCRGELESKFKKSPLHHMERDHFSSNYLSTHALRNPDNGKSAYQHDNTIRRKTQEYSSSIASPETGNSVVLCDSRQLNGELFNDISSTEEDHTVENIKNEGDVNLGFPNNRSHVLPSFNSLVTRM
ncbi:unnamed protein product [Schistosoma bovis]|nr:unnamed protein product [Schistosoma bovis]CAH8646230.1 unnamed protein product [Schistosoma bovis]